MDEGEGKADGETGVNACAFLVGRAEDYHQEEEREDSLGHECAEGVGIEVAAGGAVELLAVAVCGESAEVNAAVVGDEGEDATGDDCAQNLCAYVRAKFLAGHSAVNVASE